MPKRLFFSSFLPLFALLIGIAWPFAVTAARAKGGLLQSIRTDNVTTTGKVASVGPSTVGNGPFVIIYSYDAPGFPRNGNPGSFMREQVAKPSDLARYHSGMTIPVEYSRASPGSSRIQGFGAGSVYFSDWLQNIKYLAPILILACFGILSAFLRGRRQNV